MEILIAIIIFYIVIVSIYGSCCSSNFKFLSQGYGTPILIRPFCDSIHSLLLLLFATATDEYNNGNYEHNSTNYGSYNNANFIRFIIILISRVIAIVVWIWIVNYLYIWWYNCIVSYFVSTVCQSWLEWIGLTLIASWYSAPYNSWPLSNIIYCILWCIYSQYLAYGRCEVLWLCIG